MTHSTNKTPSCRRIPSPRILPQSKSINFSSGTRSSRKLMGSLRVAFQKLVRMCGPQQYIRLYKIYKVYKMPNCFIYFICSIYLFIHHYLFYYVWRGHLLRNKRVCGGEQVDPLPTNKHKRKEKIKINDALHKQNSLVQTNSFTTHSSAEQRNKNFLEAYGKFAGSFSETS